MEGQFIVVAAVDIETAVCLGDSYVLLWIETNLAHTGLNSHHVRF